MHNAFELIDSNRDAFIDKEDLRQFFVRHCLYVPDKELQALIERYDRELSGKISYNEFLSELTAKSIY